jgi:hypothetical protein
MSSSRTDVAPAAVGVTCSDATLTADLDDGRQLSVPLSWSPRLTHGTVAERATWQLTGRGQGIHWSELDEDILVAGLLEGRRSSDGSRSAPATVSVVTRMTACRVCRPPREFSTLPRR